MIMSYLGKEWLEKWQNIQKVQGLEQAKNDLSKKLGELALKLGQDKVKNKRLTTKNQTIFKKAQQW
jgi:hypothetical protein